MGVGEKVWVSEGEEGEGMDEDFIGWHVVFISFLWCFRYDTQESLFKEQGIFDDQLLTEEVNTG